MSLAACGSGSEAQVDAIYQDPAAGGFKADASADANVPGDDAAPLNEAGQGGAGGSAGQGVAGQAGSGDAGSAGAAGNGEAGAAGQAGAAGSGGSAGQGGSGGSAGHGGAAGQAGSAGASGSGGSGAGGTGGSGGGSIAPACTQASDCTGATSCQIVADENHASLELRCLPNVGASATGVACTAPSQCRSNLCLGGFCSAPCEDASDCSQAGTCLQETVTVDGLSGSFSLCRVEPCAASSSCDSGEVCSDIRNDGTDVHAYCRQRSPGGAAIGQLCSQHSECESLLCPTGLNTCTEACSSEADCSGTGTQWCVDIFSTASSTVAGCAAGCWRDSDCPGALVCSLGRDSAADHNRLICRQAQGSGQVGDDCAAGTCASGFCLKKYLNGTLQEQFCSTPCVTADDCPSGFERCSEVVVSTPSGAGTEFIHLSDRP